MIALGRIRHSLGRRLVASRLRAGAAYCYPSAGACREGRGAHARHARSRPLQLFGPSASEAVHALLEEHEVRLRAGRHVQASSRRTARAHPRGPHIRGTRGRASTASGRTDRRAAADCARLHSGRFALPRAGLPTCSLRVTSTSFTVKQGGIASQQADAAAEAIACSGRRDVKPKAFRPVLRGLLLTGRQPRYLRRELSVQPEHEPVPPRAAVVASSRSSATTWHRSLPRWPVSRPPRPTALLTPKRSPSKWSSMMRR